MAWAQYDPITQARVNRQKALDAAVNSPDPVERWKAKERMAFQNMQEQAAGLVTQAQANGKLRAELEANYERNFQKQIESKYKPLHR